MLATAKAVFGKISAGMASKDLDELATALEEASEAKLSNVEEAGKAQALYNELKATNDSFARALESQEFDEMRVAFEKAAYSGVSGAAYKRNVDQYMEYVRKNDRAKETALLESRAKVAKYQMSCNLEELRGAIAELHKLTGDSIDQWNVMYAGTKLEKNTESFAQSFADYTNAKTQVEFLSEVIQDIVSAMRVGAVKKLENIISQRLLPKTQNGVLPPIKEVEEANEYLAKVAEFSRRLQKAWTSKDVDILTLLFEEAEKNLNQGEDAKDVLTDQIRSQYASWSGICNKLNQNGVAWMESPKEFLDAVKKAQDMQISSDLFTVALDNAQKFVTMRLQLAFSQLREADLASARDCERELTQAVEYATILSDSVLYGRQIGPLLVIFVTFQTSIKHTQICIVWYT